MVLYVAGVFVVLLSLFTATGAVNRLRERERQPPTARPVDYDEITSGRCTSISKAHCQEIGSQTGNKFKEFKVSVRPPGCYKTGKTSLWYNNAHSTVSCQAERICLCHRVVKRSELAKLERKITTDIEKVIEEKIGRVEKSVSTRIGNIENSVSRISSLIGSMKNSISMSDARIAQNKYQQSGHARQVQSLVNSIATLKKDLDVGKPVYVDHCHPGGQDKAVTKHKVTQAECFAWAIIMRKGLDNRSEGRNWNVFVYVKSYRFCTCYANGVGCVANPHYRYYRFV